jgi:hypothetical protein
LNRARTRCLEEADLRRWGEGRIRYLVPSLTSPRMGSSCSYSEDSKVRVACVKRFVLYVKSLDKVNVKSGTNRRWREAELVCFVVSEIERQNDLFCGLI